MRFFANSLNNANWKEQAGCCGLLLLSAAISFGFLGGLVYLGYWIGTR